MLRVDFHVHTTHSSDAFISPQSLIKKAKSLSIAPAITDHWSMGSIPEFRRAGISFIPGEELRVVLPDGRSSDLIGYFLTDEIPKGILFEEALDLIKSQGGISCAPHPFDVLREGICEPALLKKVQLIEVFNSHALSGFDSRAEEFAEKEKKLRTAGSDAHFLHEFGPTYMELDLSPGELEPKPLLRALKSAKIIGKRSSRIRRAAHRIGSAFLKPFV
ncbi:MAG: PHP-associated domain-containing protein [Candidatus Bilamarchaeaceae archaeon]